MHRSVSAHLMWTTEPSHWRRRHLSPPSGELGFHTNFQRCDKKPEASPQPRVDQITLLCYNFLPWFGFNEQLRNVSIFVVSDHLYMVGVLSP